VARAVDDEQPAASLRRHGLGIGEPVRAHSPTTLFRTRSLRFDSTSAKEKEDSRSFDASGSCRSLDIDYLGAFELGANDRSAGLFDCPSKLETAASKESGLRGGPVRQSCPLYPRKRTSQSVAGMSVKCHLR
jgi:hypothetical protein